MNHSIVSKEAAFSDLMTPCLLLDTHQLQINIDRMHQRLQKLDVAIRPHLKTCKSIDVARLLQAAGVQGFTVSTLAEAEYFHRHGLQDLLYAVGIAPGKLDACARLQQQGLNMTLVLDQIVTAEMVVAAAKRLDTGFRVSLEIDCDGERGGFHPDDREMIQSARILERGGCEVAGVMTHAGGSYRCGDTDCIRRAAANERNQTVAAADRLRDAGFAAPVVSVGSTPTVTYADDLSGVTEARPGTYVFQDLVQANLGVCSLDDIAISVLCEVIGHRPGHGEVIIDAGWMALSRDRGTAEQIVDYGYGQVCDKRGAVLDGVIVYNTNQEHGIVRRRDGEPLPMNEYPIGRRLRVLPNHACATAAKHGGYHIMENGRWNGQFWGRTSGW